MNNDEYDSHPYRNANVNDDEEKKPLDEKEVKITFTGDAFDGMAEEKPEFTGLTKEQLKQYANDPFWRNLRRLLLALFWVLWLAMLVGAVLIVVFNRRCPYNHLTEYARRTPFYEVCPATFADSNDDGLGDLEGVTRSIEYMKTQLGVGALWLTSIFAGPDAQPSDRVSDYRAIHNSLGNEQDFEHLVNTAKDQNLKLILDFIPNHTSRNHSWFLASSANASDDNPYLDFYIWANETDLPQDTSTWTFVESRNQSYFHTFAPDQPDLNMHSKAVIKEITNALDYWHKKGVDGFVIRHANYLIEPNEAKNESQLSSVHRSVDMILQLRTNLNRIAKDAKNSSRILLIADMNDELELGDKILFYGNRTAAGADMLINNALLKLENNYTSDSLAQVIEASVENAPAEKQQNWRVASPYVSRVASRLGPSHVDLMNVINVMLPGTPFIYYGNEFGMQDDNTLNGDARFQAPLPKVDLENEHFKVLRDALKLRSEREVLVERNQSFTRIASQDKEVFAFVRIHYHRTTAYIVVADLRETGEPKERDLTYGADVRGEGTVEVAVGPGTEGLVGQFYHVQHFKTSPKQILIIRVGNVDMLPEEELQLI